MGYARVEIQVADGNYEAQLEFNESVEVNWLGGVEKHHIHGDWQWVARKALESAIAAAKEGLRDE